METKMVKKVLTIIALVTLIIDIGLLISAIFGAPVFEWGILTKILLSSVTLTVASAFAITAVGYINKQRVLSIITLSMLGLLCIFAFVIYWNSILFNNVFTQITVTLAILTVTFCLLVNVGVRLDKKFFALQIVTYILMAISDILLILLVWGVPLFSIAVLSQIIGVIFLVTFALLCSLSILSRKNQSVNDETKVSVESVTISKLEYQALKRENEELKAEIKKLKGEE